MKKGIPKKIHIIGSVGSGKTTLAKELSARLQIPYYELDNIVWKRHKSGDIRRTENERKVYLQTIIDSGCWIVEGVHNEEWVKNSFQHAELIIFLDTNYSIRSYRIIKRFVLQKLGLERSNYNPTMKIFLKMFKWNRYFEKEGKPNFLNEFAVYHDKTLIVTKNDDIKNYFKIG